MNQWASKHSDQRSGIPTVFSRYAHGQSSAVRKTFKKLYEQKDLVRNTKDQYGAICDNIWKQSHQRLIFKVPLWGKNIQLDIFDIRPGAFGTQFFPNKCEAFGTESLKKSSLGDNSTITHLTCLDFFDVKHSKKLNNSNHRYSIRDISKTSYQKNWIPEMTNQTAQLSNWLMTLSSDQEIESPNDFFIKNIEIKSNRINTAKLLRRDDTSTLSEGRSVVNTALETYSKRVKVKTLAEINPSYDTI